MYEQSVAAIYSSLSDAKSAVKALEQSDFPNDQVSLATRSDGDKVSDQEELDYGDKSETNAARGAGVGGVLGALLGAPLLAIPGVGLVLLAGPLAAGLTGAIVGGFLGSISGWGVHEDHVREYEEKVKEGFHLVIAAGDPQETALAKRVLSETNADEVHLHAANSADAVDK